MYLKSKYCILVVNLKRPGIPTHLILMKLTWYACVPIFVNKDKLLFLILLQNKWNYVTFRKKFQFTSLYIMMSSQEITEMSHNESFKMFFYLYFGCQIKHKFVHQKWLCEFINIFRCHSDGTKRSTLILTPNVNSHGLLISISTDRNLRYVVLFKNALFGCNVIWPNQ